MSNPKQIKQLLWINKVIKFPFTNGQSPDDVQEELADLICSISQEFRSHRHELYITAEDCKFGPQHKKVIQTSLTILTVQINLAAESSIGALKCFERVVERARIPELQL